MITVPINIDLSSLADEFKFTNDQVVKFTDDVVSKIAMMFAHQLETEAQKALRSTRTRYIRSIKLINEGPGRKAVMLDMSDSLVAMIEDGAQPFDMKVKMLESPKVKIGKNGTKYLTIPFRWGVPSSIAESDVFSFKMPVEIHKIAKEKKVVIPVAGGGMRAPGVKFNEIPQPYNAQTQRDAIMDTQGAVLFDTYLHRSNIYEGIHKHTDGVTGQNVYKSFRRVSENSDPLAFIHPGIKQYNLFAKALDSLDVNLENELTRAVDTTLLNMGFK